MLSVRDEEREEDGECRGDGGDGAATDGRRFLATAT